MASWMRFYIACIVLCLGGASTSAQEADRRLAFFEEKIRPVLVQHCYQCHSAAATQIKGNLLLDTKQGVLAGGDSGTALVPRDPDASLLLSALRYEDYEMPPKGKLPDKVIADFETWIKAGAHDPRESEAPIKRDIDIEAGRQFWAFQPRQEVSIPEVNFESWPRNAIDYFVLSKQEQHGLHPIRDVDGAAWLRRVTIDLIGLPPTPTEIDQFLGDTGPDARQRVVDRLLDSRHFGERWGRHWLDLARYAESTGRTRNFPLPVAWRYRDYVIDAFNTDVPYDQFLLEQIAGDLVDEVGSIEERDRLRIATGFLALGAPDLNERDAATFKMDMVADQIDTLSRSILGLTVSCARCHDHKFDPIPTNDYYALAGIFRSTDILNGYSNRVGGGNRAKAELLVRLGEPVKKKQGQEDELEGLSDAQRERISRAVNQQNVAQKRIDEIKSDSSLAGAAKRKQLANAKKQYAAKTRQLEQLKKKFVKSKATTITGPACVGVRDARHVADCKVHIRGDTKRLGDAVPRGFLQVLSSGPAIVPTGQSGRKQLAEWIIDPENPLTARVMVNRVWQKLFGAGLVRTLDNFGAMGADPTHPELLDYLASDFVSNGWSIKELIRQMVLSRTYGLDVVNDPAHAGIDADNRMLWRMNARRLEFETLRDTMLMVSGELRSHPYSGSIVANLPASELNRQKIDFDIDQFSHRSIYLPMMRTLLPQEMLVFDVPEGIETTGARDVTTVPTQWPISPFADSAKE